MPFAAVALAPVLALPQLASAHAPAELAPTCRQVPSTFGRMFPGLPSARWPDDQINALAAAVMAEPEAEETPEGEPDAEENGDIDAGYTYVGQFIDHDLTLDNRPDDLTTPVAPQSLTNGRTPAFDLDSVYGAGPAGSPQLYAADHVHLLLGAPLTGTPADPGSVDLPRNPQGQALAGDGRDDENRIVAGLHTIMLRFHNAWADRLAAQHPGWPAARVFAEAQQQVRWHYQWAVLSDFLPTVVGRRALDRVFPANAPAARLAFFRPCQTGTPVEFSVAAYRFGHSMVRPIYRLNAGMPARLPVFASPETADNDIGGFRPSPPSFSVDWRFFFPMDRTRSVGVPQSSYKIDNSLVFPLSLLPLGAAGSGPTSLAQRNLLRSEQLGLPTGQSVARAMRIRPLPPDQILIGKATGEEDEAEPITAISADLGRRTPLWTYVLAEATAGAFRVRGGRIVGSQAAPFRLGPVGGQIVAETFAGMLEADRASVLHARFRPEPAVAPGGRFGFKELIQATISGALTRNPGPAARPGAARSGPRAHKRRLRIPVAKPSDIVNRRPAHRRR
jgi:hypothetical protein